jgi:spermidine synthase
VSGWLWFQDRFSSSEHHYHGFKKVIRSFKSNYQEIQLVDSASFGKMLLIDGDVQSAILDEHIYHEALVLPGIISGKNSPEKVFLCGGGEGATLREILRCKSMESVIKCDIDQEAIQMYMEELPEWHQGSFFDPRVTLIHMDARKLLEEQIDGSFDGIYTDLTEPVNGGPSQLLYSKEFFNLCRSKLTENGYVAVQGSLLRLTDYEMHASIVRTMKEVFPIVRSYASYIASFDTTWGFIYASFDADPMEMSKEEVDRRISERLSGTQKFYDGIAHQQLFSLGKNLRKLIDSSGSIITDDRPFSLKKKSDL